MERRSKSGKSGERANVEDKSSPIAKKEDGLWQSGLSLVGEGQKTELSALHESVNRRSHEGLNRYVCKYLFNMFKEDDVKLFLSLTSESVHMSCGMVPPEHVHYNFVKSEYVLGASSKMERRSSERW